METIKKHKIKLDKLKSKGFNFVIQISTGDLMNVEFDNKNLALGDYLIIIGEVNESEVKTLIPKDLQKNTFYVSEPLNTEVIKQ